MSELIDKTVKGTFWAYGAEVIAKVITPLSFIILTRVISPEEYGIVAVATTVLTFVNIISDLGTSQVIIQTPEADPEKFNKICNVGFWINVIFGGLLFLLIEIFSEQIADYYHQPDSKLVIQIMSIQIVLICLSSIQNSIKKKNLDFKYLFYLRLITIFTPLVVAIPIAFAGGGLWAIVCSSLVGTLLQTFFLWKNNIWKPSFSFSFDGFRYLLSKSIWNTFNQIFIWIPVGLDALLIGKYMNATDLGLYTTSRNLFTSCSGLIIAPIVPVVFSALSKEDNNSEFLRISYYSQKILFSVSVFFVLFVFLFADNITAILFNTEWSGITPIIQIVFVVLGYEYFGAIITETLRAKGLFKQMSVVYFCSLFFIVPSLFLCAGHASISWYTLIRTLTLAIPMLGMFMIASKLKIYFFRCVKNNIVIIISSILLLCAAYLLKDFNLSDLQNVAVKLLLYVLFVSIFVIFNRELVKAILVKMRAIMHL